MTDRSNLAAQPGMLRLVHFDVRDRHPSIQGDFDTASDVKKHLRESISGYALEVGVYDDKGEEVTCISCKKNLNICEC